MGGAEKLGVYVSVPFCRAKCSFCNFASGVGDGSAMERYVGQLCAEIVGARGRAEAMGAELPERVDTVYFGGGTPSLLSPAQLERIFGALRAVFAVEDDAEITLEAAPGQIAEDVLDAAMRLGVNRVSLGVQSFVDRECTAVGRLHTGKDCVREIVRLRGAGVAEVGADLIAGLPYQTAESWEVSLRTAAEVGLTHLSVYMLEVDEDSRLGREVLAGGLRFHAPGVPADEASAAMYEAACAWLPEHGFAQYEISNFAGVSADGREHRSRHNVKYWRRAPYVGFGLDAHSMLSTEKGAVRFANADELGQYGRFEQAAGLSAAAAKSAGSGRDDRLVVMQGAVSSRGETTFVGQREAFEEAVFLGLRMNEGVAGEALLAEFQSEWVGALEESARELAREGLMVLEDGCWRLTLRGRLVSNDVFGALLEGVAA